MLKTYSKTSKIFVFALLTAALLMSVISPSISTVKAQTPATVEILTTIGGSISSNGATLTPGTIDYNVGDSPVFTAVPADSGSVFVDFTYSSVSGAFTDTDNPLTLTLNDTAYTLEANFEAVTFLGSATKDTSATNAIVVILAANGGTTSPPPGTYALANAASFDITAIPDSGWTFTNWIIAGTPLNHGIYSLTLTPTNNPYDVDHGYGNTYSYQPVFLPPSSTVTMYTPVPTAAPSKGISTDTGIIIALAVIVVIIVIVFGAYAYMKRTKK